MFFSLEPYIQATFAVVIFYSDGLLSPKLPVSPFSSSERKRSTWRFFLICAQLPLELQMVLCHRMYGSPKDVIPAGESESAFRELARAVTRS